MLGGEDSWYLRLVWLLEGGRVLHHVWAARGRVKVRVREEAGLPDSGEERSAEKERERQQTGGWSNGYQQREAQLRDRAAVSNRTAAGRTRCSVPIL